MLIPIGKKILISPFESDQGKIIIQNAKPTKFMVMAIGDEVTKVVPNDIIFLEKHYGVEIKHDSVTYIVIEENSILAKLNRF